MAPKKRRQQTNNKENIDENAKNMKFDPLSIQSIIDKNLHQFDVDFNQQYKEYESKIQEKLAVVHREFEKYLQTHESQAKLARLLDQQITRMNQQQQNHGAKVQELLDKTSDLMNASMSDTSRTKTYLIGELKMLSSGTGNK